MALKTQIKRIETARKKYETELGKLNRKAIAAALGEVLPEGFALTWTQYTPGFNDGNPCRFTVGEVTLCTIKKVEEIEAVEPADEPSEETVEAAAAEPDPITGEVLGPELVEDLPESPGQVETADEKSVEVQLSDEERDFDDEDGDEGTTSLEYGDHADLKWCGMTRDKYRAVRAAWNLIKDKAILEKAFGDDKRIVVRSGGKFTVESYECGY